MTQIISNRTGREKIIKAEGENTEIKIIAKESEEFIHINAEIKLNKEHNFKDDYNIFLQAYESSGIAKEPWNLGTVGKTGEYAFSFKELNIESLLLAWNRFNNPLSLSLVLVGSGEQAYKDKLKAIVDFNKTNEYCSYKFIAHDYTTLKNIRYVFASAAMVNPRCLEDIRINGKKIDIYMTIEDIKDESGDVCLEMRYQTYMALVNYKI